MKSTKRQGLGIAGGIVEDPVGRVGFENGEFVFATKASIEFQAQGQLEFVRLALFIVLPIEKQANLLTLKSFYVPLMKVWSVEHNDSLKRYLSNYCVPFSMRNS